MGSTWDIFFFFFLSKKKKKEKNILLLLLEGGSLFSSKFLLIPVNKEEKINKYSSSRSLRVVLYFQLYFLFLHVKKNKINIKKYPSSLFLSGRVLYFQLYFLLLPVKKKGKKNYSSSPSLREVLYFHQNFLLLSVEKKRR